MDEDKEVLKALKGSEEEARQAVLRFNADRQWLAMCVVLRPLLDQRSDVCVQLNLVMFRKNVFHLDFLFDSDELLLFLLELGLDPDMPVDMNRNTMLHIAASKGKVRVMRSLLVHGAHFLENRRGQLPLDKIDKDKDPSTYAFLYYAVEGHKPPISQRRVR